MAPALHVPEQWLRFRATDRAGARARQRREGRRLARDRAPARRARARAAAAARGRRPRAPASSEAEQWGDEVLQPVPRAGSSWTGVVRAAGRARELLGGLETAAAAASCSGSPRRGSRAWRAGATEAATQQARKDLAALPAQLDQVDAWIAEGVHRRRASRTPPTCRSRRASRLLATIGRRAGRCWRAARASRSRMRLFPSYSGRMPPGALRCRPRRSGSPARETPRRRVERGERVGERGRRRASPARGSSSSSGISTKRRLGDLGVRQPQPLGRVRQVAEQQHVDVDRARRVARRRRPRGPARARPPCTRRAAPRARAPSRSAGRR